MSLLHGGIYRIIICEMTVKESVQNIFKPKEIKEAERIEQVRQARRQEKVLIYSYLRDEISLKELNQLLEVTHPLTRFSLSKIASKLK